MKHRIVKVTNSYSKEVFYVIEWRFLFIWFDEHINGMTITYDTLNEAKHVLNVHTSKQIKEVI